MTVVAISVNHALFLPPHNVRGIMETNEKRGKVSGVKALTFLLLLSMQILVPTSAQVIRQDDLRLGSKEHIPVYLWRDRQVKPKALAIAIHGLVMHGGVYDVLARRLAAQGFIVLAPDLRGYGRWVKEQGAEKRAGLDYEQSFEDLMNTTKAFKSQYPNLPLYAIGESLGADLALHLASAAPGLVDGLVLSSPAIKRRSFCRSIMVHASRLLRKPQMTINLIPYIKRYASEDPRVIEETLNDPLVRKKMTTFDLIKTCTFIKPTLQYAEQVPAAVPVLIMQGSKDRVVRSNAVMLLLSHLKSRDQTVRWFSERGHVLLETSFAHPDTLRTIEAWLQEHILNNVVLEASNNYEDPPSSAWLGDQKETFRASRQ
jgi:acylglycerol lipase